MKASRNDEEDGAMLAPHQCIERLLARLDGMRPLGSEHWIACCPAHADKTPSLSIRCTEERVLLHCFAGCATESILTALGLTWTDLYPDRWQASYRAATAPGPMKLLAPDDRLDVDRWVLMLAAADLRAGKMLNIEDRARVELAKFRLEAVLRSTTV